MKFSPEYLLGYPNESYSSQFVEGPRWKGRTQGGTGRGPSVRPREGDRKEVQRSRVSGCGQPSDPLLCARPVSLAPGCLARTRRGRTQLGSVCRGPRAQIRARGPTVRPTVVHACAPAGASACAAPRGPALGSTTLPGPERRADDLKHRAGALVPWPQTSPTSHPSEVKKKKHSTHTSLTPSSKQCVQVVQGATSVRSFQSIKKRVNKLLDNQGRVGREAKRRREDSRRRKTSTESALRRSRVYPQCGRQLSQETYFYEKF